MKRFEQLTQEQKQAAISRAMMLSTRKLYNGGLSSDPQVRKDVIDLVKEAEKQYFDDASGGSFCGCSTCLMYLTKAIKSSKFGQVKEIIISDAQKTVESTFFLEPGDRSEVI